MVSCNSIQMFRTVSNFYSLRIKNALLAFQDNLSTVNFFSLSFLKFLKEGSRRSIVKMWGLSLDKLSRAVVKPGVGLHRLL